jgi:MYND finger
MEADRCDHCSESQASHICGACQAVAYCGASCQKSHWEQDHKNICFNVNNPDMTHLSSLIKSEAPRDPLFREVHEALIESPNDSDLQEIAVLLGQFLVGETADEKFERYQKSKAKELKVSKRKGFRGKLENFYYKAKRKLDLKNQKRIIKNKSWKERKQSYAPSPPVPPQEMAGNKVYF